MPYPYRIPLAAICAVALLPLTGCAETPADHVANKCPAPDAEAPAPKAPEEPAPAPGTAKKIEDAQKPEGAVVSTPAEAKPESDAGSEESLRLEELNLKKNLLETELAVSALKSRRSGTLQEADRTNLEARAELRQARNDTDNAAALEAKAAAERTESIATLKSSIATFRSSAKAREIELEFKIKKLEADAALARITTETSRKKQAKLAGSVIERAETNHPLDPFHDGVLAISDRRIALNGNMTDPVARDMIDRVSFLNRRDAKAPIFIVIDSCSGGSLMAGYQFAKAIESSLAPVHVVVRGEVGGVASLILAAAPHSYVLGSTFVAHSEPSVYVRGSSVTQAAEGREQTKAFFARLYAPLARKTGIDAESFIKQLYANNSRANWVVAGNDAVRLKWADHLVTKIEETGLAEIAPAIRTIGAVEFHASSPAANSSPPPLAPGDSWLGDERGAR